MLRAAQHWLVRVTRACPASVLGVGVVSWAEGGLTVADGGTGRPDLMLSAKTEEHDCIRHLVVALKTPAVNATDTEASQIKKYARAVIANPQFADMRSEWGYILLLTDYDESVRRDINQEGRPSGILDQPRIDPNSPMPPA